MAETMKATFGAGCFWGVEHIFRSVPGVISVTSGYEGGTLDNPSYRDVCTGATGHAEVVEIEFDPAQVTYSELVHVFWELHDPTTLNRQGPDHGTQYRSAIFFHSPEQKADAEKSKEWAQQFFSRPIVTEITESGTFYAAEEYHQRYFERHGNHGCHIRRPLGR